VPFIGSPHNLYIEVAVEQGIFGLLAWLAVIAVTLVLAWRAYRVMSPDTQMVGAGTSRVGDATGLPLGGAVAMLLVLLLHGLVDDPLYARRVALLLFLAPMGLIVAAWQLARAEIDLPAPSTAFRPEGRPELRSGRSMLRAYALPVLAIALIAAALVAFRTPLTAAWHANLGALAQTRAELTVYDPENFGDPTIDEARRRADTAAAEAHFRTALALAPAQPTSSQRLSLLARARGDYAVALALVEPLVETGAADRVTQLLYGDALVANGQVVAAAAAVNGLPFARSRLLGQAWEYQALLDDAQRAAWANEAAALVTDDGTSPVSELGAP